MRHYKPFSSLSEMLAGVASLPEQCTDSTPEMQRNHYRACEITNTKQQTLVIKQFTTDSYNGPKTEDFLNRLEMVFASAQAILKERSIDDEMLRELRQAAAAELSAECAIDPIPLSEIADEQHESAVVAKINQANQILQRFVVQAIALFEPNAFEDVQQLEKARRLLIEKESELTTERGSPNFINFYTINGVQRVSAARVVGDAIPSTERSAKQWGKLPNFKQSSMGYLAPSGEYVAQLDVYRHSSYLPFKIKNKFKQQQATLAMVEGMMAEMAQQQLNAGGKEPLVLKMSSLSLLSPVVLCEALDVTDAVALADESEYRQLQACHEALRLINGQELTVTLADGRLVRVKPETNLINAALNPHGIYASKKWQSALERQINASGMLAFMQQTEQDLSAKGLNCFDFNLTKLQNGLDAKKQRLMDASANVRACLRSGDQAGYKKAHQAQKVLRKDLQREEMSVMKELKSQWAKRRGEFVQFLEQLEHAEPRQDLPNLYYQTLAMFLDGQVEPSQFGARYLLLRRLLGDQVDFFCKSGEDRTGRLNNLLEELCEFKRASGYYPRYDLTTKSIAAADRVPQQLIAQSVSEFSISRDINDQNSHGARGLQISSSIKAPILGELSNALNVGLPNKSSNRLGKLAKSIYDSIKLKKWFELLLGVSNKKQTIINSALQPLAANRLIVDQTRDLAGFTTRLVKANKISPAVPTPVEIQATTEPTYRGVRLKAGECLVAEKWCALAEANSQPVLGCIEQDLTSLRNTTRLAPGQQLALKDSIALALQHASMLLRPPFNAKKAITIDGADPIQVARTHAAVLCLKEAHPSLQPLIIHVKGQSVRPERATRWESQRAKDKAFIQQQLGDEPLTHALANDQKHDLAQLLNTQQRMKSLLKADKTNETLPILPGQRFSKKT